LLPFIKSTSFLLARTQEPPSGETQPGRNYKKLAERWVIFPRLSNACLNFCPPDGSPAFQRLETPAERFRLAQVLGNKIKPGVFYEKIKRTIHRRRRHGGFTFSQRLRQAA
jgi:hypothetical protein